MPLTYLAETVATWNGYVESGVDPDFEREVDAPMNRIGTAPFYALSIMVIWHDSYGGLRVNGRQQVVDMQCSGLPRSTRPEYRHPPHLSRCRRRHC